MSGCAELQYAILLIDFPLICSQVRIALVNYLCDGLSMSSSPSRVRSI